jgi:mRNA-degrading endonuclease RelE of RelBE toxin-antitoxin system
MRYNIYTTPNFDKEAKRLIKKYPSLIKEISLLADSLSENPMQGVDMGANVRKVRWQ